MILQRDGLIKRHSPDYFQFPFFLEARRNFFNFLKVPTIRINTEQPKYTQAAIAGKMFVEHKPECEQIKRKQSGKR